jgi:hypothetical protein
MTSTQHTAHFCVHEHEKFKNAIQINQNHSRTSRKTYGVAQRHGLSCSPTTLQLRNLDLKHSLCMKQIKQENFVSIH